MIRMIRIVTLLLPLARVAIATLAVAASRSADLINSRQLHVQHYAVIIRAVVKDDVLLIASRPERSGGVHKGVFTQLPRGQLPQGSLGGRCKPAAPAGCMHAPQNPHS